MPDLAIFAVTNRTGSTLLQRIFNANPSTVMWGENGRALMRMTALQGNALKFSRSMAKTREHYFKNDRPIDVDISCMSPRESVINAAVIEAARALLRGMYPKETGKRVGFKEVAHRPMAVDLFRSAFPEAQTVFLARHPVAAWKSHPQEWPVQLERFIDTWRTNVAGYQQRGKLFWFEDLISDQKTQQEIRDLARITKQAFDAVLSAKVNSTGAKSVRPQQDFNIIMAACEGMIPEHIAQKVASKAA